MASIKALIAAYAFALVTVPEEPPSNTDECNSQIDPRVDLEINRRDHMTVKVPYLFAVASPSTATLLTSSMLDFIDVGSTQNPTPPRAKPI